MARVQDDYSEHEAQLNSIIAKYVEAIEQGQAPDDESLLAAHPKFARELADFLADRRDFQAVAQPYLEDPDKTQKLVDTSHPHPLPDQPLMATTRLFGDYELLEEIARGGMGVVYKARQTSLGRAVALKMILSGHLATAEEVERFYFEARAAAQIQHPNIVAVHEVGQRDGHHFFSMEYVAGCTLARLLRDGPLAPERATRYVQTIAEAVHYAHQHGILHRDLKPSNVLIDADDRPRVSDFGLAKRMDNDSELTGTGQVLGTASYMAPEQCRGKERDARLGPATDVYALGAILYACLVCRPPFQAANRMETMLQVLEHDPVPIRRYNSRVAPDLETICVKCLEKDQAKRYASADALADDLRRFLAREPIVARPIGAFARALKWGRRRPTAAALIGVSVAAVLIVFATLVVSNVAIARKQAETEQALSQRTEALSAEQRALYSNNVALAQHEWEAGNVERARQLLDGCRPQRGQDDMRGWEWHYLQRLLHGYAFELRGRQRFYQATFSPDGRRLAALQCGSALGSCEVDVWNARTRELEFSIFYPDRPKSDVEPLRWNGGVAMSPNGRHLAASTYDGYGGVPAEVRIIDVVDKKIVNSVRHSRTLVRADGLTYSPDGRWLSIYWSSKFRDDLADEIQVVEATTGKELFHVAADSGYWFDLVVRFSSDSQRIAGLVKSQSTNNSQQKQCVRIWQLSDGREIRRMQFGAERSLAGFDWSHDNRHFVTIERDGRALEVWDADTGALVRHVTMPKRPHCVTFSHDDRRLVTGNFDGSLCVWNAQTGDLLAELRGPEGSVYFVEFSPDGSQIVSTPFARSAIMVWDATRTGPHWNQWGRQLLLPLSGRQLATTAAFCWAPTFSPDGRQLAVCAEDGRIIIWDVELEYRIRTIPNPFKVSKTYTLAFSPDGKWLAAGAGAWGVRILDVATGKTIRELPTRHDEATCVKFTRDGTKLASCGSGGFVRVWKMPEGTVLSNPKGHENLVHQLDFSPDGRWLATCGRDKTIRIWDASSGAELHVLRGHQGEVFTVSFSPDGQTVVSGSDDLTSRIWDVASGQLVRELEPSSTVCPCIFSTDGRRVFSLVGNMVCVSSATTGQTILRIGPMVTDTIYGTALAQSPDGRRLAVCMLGGRIIFLDGAPWTGQSESAGSAPGAP